MAQLAPIVINDGQTTPVAHTFTPNSESGVVTKFVELSANGSLNSRNTMEIAVKPIGLNGRKTQEITAIIHLPEVVTETVNGVNRDKIVGVNHAEFKVVASGVSAKQARKNARVLLLNLLQNAKVISLVDDAESFTS